MNITPDLSEVAVVVLNYNTAHLLEKFLPILLKHSGNAQIVVADNASPDHSANFVTQSFPQVELVCIPENKGFCAGYNYALAKINAKYFVLLNSDVEVTPDWLTPMFQLLESKRQIACCQPKILSWHQKDQFEYAGAAGGLIDALGYPFCRGRLFDHLEFDHGQYSDTLPVFWATGACLFIRSELYRQFGGLDEDFFAHMEEIDLCWRLKNGGYEAYYQGKSTVYHMGGGTLSALNPEKTFLNFRNNLYMLTKNLPSKRLWPIIFVRLILDGIAALRFLGQKQGGKHFTAVLNAHFAYYSKLSTMLQKRKGNVAENDKMVGRYRGSILMERFLKKRNKTSEFFEV